MGVPSGTAQMSPGEAEAAQIVQKTPRKAALAPQVGDVLLGEAEVLDIVDDLLQTGRDGEAASIGHVAEEDIEIADLVRRARSENSRCPW